MTFISFYFLLYVVIIASIYFIVPLKYRWYVLLVGSTLLYTISEGKKILLIVLATTFIAYYGAIWIERTENTQKKKRRLILSSVSLLVIACLVFAKFYTYCQWSFLQHNLIPVGISYYTFSIISYLADVYWKKDKAERNFLKLALFILFFPKILQGPISRHRNLAPQLLEGHRFNYQNFCFGIQLMLWGYFKKLVIADRINILTMTIFRDISSYGGCLLLVGLMLATVQLYCDFSGYMDIAGGISQIFSINLEKNFDHPFFSKSAAEFWRRWHITLGTWFKDYVYMPIVISPRLAKTSGWIKKHVGMRAAKAFMTAVPLAVVWILTGLWHGTGMSYFVWGIYWGLIIISSTIFAPEIKKLNTFLHINTDAPSWGVFQMVRTFFLFCIGRLITIPGDLQKSWAIIKTIFTSGNVWELMDGTLYNLGLDRANFNLMILSIGFLWFISILQTRGSVRESLSKWNAVFRWGFYCIAFLTVMIFGIYGSGYDASAFVYMGY